MLPGIQAAFVDIGTEKSAFLHASDLVYPDGDGDDDDDDDDDDARRASASPTRGDARQRRRFRTC